MSAYGWFITHDHFDGSDTGTIGPSNIAPDTVKALEAGEGERFRMLDDDRNLIYSGRIFDGRGGFEPLDDFGTPNAGCTIIQYSFVGKRGTAWQDL